MTEIATTPMLPEAHRLKSNVVDAIRWSGGILLVSRLVILLRTIAIARIVGPGEFGRFAAALLAIGIVETMSETGFRTALIQRSEIDKRTLNTVWTLQCVRGAVLALGMLVAAPWVGAFFKDSAIASLVRVLAVSSLITGVANIGTVSFERDLRFDRQFRLVVTGSLVDVAVSLAVVLMVPSAWALVAGAIAGGAARVVASFRLHDFRPRWSLDIPSARSLFRFGRWMAASAILIFLIEHLDDFTAGVALGPAALGIYQVAYRIMNLPATELGMVVSDVAFPAYSRVQQTPDMLHAAFRRLASGMLAVAIPAVGCLALLLSPVTAVTLGPEWMRVVPVGQILTLFVILRLFGTSVGSLYLAIGRPDYVTKLAIFQVTLLAGTLALFVPRWGLIGIAWGVVLPMTATQCAGVILASRVGRVRLGELVWQAGHPVLASSLAAGIASIALRLRDPMLVIGVGASLYWSAYAVLFELLGRRYGGASLRNIVSDMLARKRGRE